MEIGWNTSTSTALIAGSFVVPGLPVVPLVTEGYAVATGRKSWLEAAPKLTYGLLATLPSIAAATYFTPWPGLKRLFLSPVFGRSYMVMFHPAVRYPLLAGALFGLAYDCLTDYKKEKISPETMADTLFVAATFLMAGFRTAPRLQTKHIGDDIIRYTFAHAKKGLYRGGLLSKLNGLRLFFFHSAPRALWAYHLPNGAHRIGNRVHLENDLRILRTAGITELVVKGSEHLVRATRGRTHGTMIMQHVHWDLTDWSVTDAAARLSGIDMGQFIKADLRQIPIFRMACAENLGHRAMIANKNFAGNAEVMHTAFGQNRPGRHGMAFLEYVTWTRTSKNAMTATHGPDTSTRLWKPHWEPYARAIAYGRYVYPKFCVVPSVIRRKGSIVEIEFFPPVSVRPYLKRGHGKSLEELAKVMRDDQVKWLERHVIGKDGYFTSYVDEYYTFKRGGTSIRGT